MRTILIAAMAALLIPLPALAQTVGLVQALREAVTQRPAAVAAREQALAVRHAAGEARSYYLPKVTAAENFAATNEPGNSMFMTLNQEKLNLGDPNLDLNHPGTTKDFETKVTLEQPLFNPDVSYGYHRAQKGAEAAAANARWSEEQIAFGAYASYLGLQQAHAALDWAESSHKDALEMLRVATQRREAGIGLKADELRATLRTVPLERLLVETDAPYLAPLPYRGKRNEPAFVVNTASALADLKGVPADEIARLTTDNFFSLFTRAERPL